MNNLPKLVVLLVFSTISFPSFSASCGDAVGVWKNDLGSTLLISKDEKGIISGTFQLSPDIDSFKYPMVGVINTKPNAKGNSNVTAISFSVHWGFLGSISNWVGVCRETKSSSELELIGHQVVPNAKQVNEHVYTHQDTFYSKLES